MLTVEKGATPFLLAEPIERETKRHKTKDRTTILKSFSFVFRLEISPASSSILTFSWPSKLA